MKLVIGWKHLELGGKTCVRCGDTGQNIQEAVGRLREDCQLGGDDLVLKELKIGRARLSESNEINFNGIPLEKILPNLVISQSRCPSCRKIIGKSGSCRTIDCQNQRYETIPTDLIYRAACQILSCC